MESGFLFLAHHEARGLLVCHDDHVADLHALRLGQDEVDHVGDVLCLERIHAFIDGIGAGLVAVEAHFAECGLHDARLDGGDFDIAVDDVDADAVAEGLDGRFGGAVHGGSRIGVEAGGGAEIDDMAAVSFEHGRQEGPGDEEEAPDIGVDHLLNVVRRGLAVGLEAAGEACVIDEHVRHAAGLHDFVRGGADGVSVAHVEGPYGDLCIVLHAEILRRIFQFFSVPRREGQTVALGREGFRGGAADAAGRAGDECKLTHGHASFVFLFIILQGAPVLRDFSPVRTITEKGRRYPL